MREKNSSYEAGAEARQTPERVQALRVAEAVATAASRNIEKLAELIQRKNLSISDSLIISEAAKGIRKAQNIAYGLSEEKALARYTSPQPVAAKADMEEIKRIRRDLNLSDE